MDPQATIQDLANQAASEVKTGKDGDTYDG